MTGEESYRLLARHYDAIHASKPYEREARRVVEHLTESVQGEIDSVLDAACGTGRHVAELVGRFDCVGVDANAGMLRLARKRVPEAAFVQADMCSLSLDRRFDAMTCLFGSIGYLGSWERLDQALASFAAHLRAGGAFAIESWIPPERFERGPVRRVRSFEGDGRAIARLALAKPPVDGRSHLSIEWLICEGDEQIRCHHEEQTLGVFGVERTRDLLAKHGLEASVHEGLEPPRVLFVGRRA